MELSKGSKFLAAGTLGKMEAVKSGDQIALHYVATGPRGELVASSAGGPALEMEAAGADVIAGLSMGVIGMRVGEHKILQLAPAQAFGDETGAVERLVEANRLPSGVQVGDVVRIAMAGMSALIWVVAHEGDGFRVRTQHPLAGQPIEMEIELVSIEAR